MTRSITVREPEYTSDDLRLLVASRREDQIPRNRFGVPLKDATDPAKNPYAANASGRWRVEAYADYSAEMVEKFRKARAASVDPEDDWPLHYVVQWESATPDEPEGETADGN